MFQRKKTFLIVAIFLIGWTIYMFANREHFIREHLSNPNPTLFSLQNDLDTANQTIQQVQQTVQNMKQQGEAQGAQAAAMMASLQAIPAGSPNTIIPTR